MPDDPEQHSAISCPACGQQVEISTISGAPLRCDECGEQFIIDDEPPDPHIEDAPTADEHLELARIAQISRLRRATYRSRSHAIIAAVVCGVALVQLIFLIIDELRSTLWSGRLALYVSIALMASFGIVFFFRSARRLS